MDLSEATSRRNAEARTVLAAIYDQCGGSTVTSRPVNVSRSGRPFGLDPGRALDAISRLADRGYLRIMVVTTAGPLVTITTSGVDAHESKTELDVVLPVLRDAPAVEPAAIQGQSEEVAAALRDADAAIGRGEPENAVDRVHTALHTRIREICRDQGIPLGPDAEGSLVGSFAVLWRAHPEGPKSNKRAERVMHNLGTALQSLNDLRNHDSLAHARGLLDPIDATLAINATRAIAQYVEARFAPKK